MTSRLLHRLSRAVAAATFLVSAAAGLGAADAPAQPLPGGKDSAPKAQSKFIYKLTTNDRIRIVVFGENDLSAAPRIDINGNVNLYLVGDVHLSDLTVTEAQKVVENAYRDGRFLRNPQVNISVEDYAPRTITVDGQVKNPGSIPLPTESTLTVYQAIMRAGGFTDIAKGSEVRVTRLLPGGTKKVFTIDIDNLIKGKDRARMEDDTLLLEPGDIIWVPERLI